MAVLLMALIAVGAACLAVVALWFAQRNNNLLGQIDARLDGIDSKVDDVATLQGAVRRTRDEGPLSPVRHLRGLKVLVPVAAAAVTAGAVMTDSSLIHQTRPHLGAAAADPAQPTPVECHSPPPPEPDPRPGEGGAAATRSVEPPSDAPVAVPAPSATAVTATAPTTTTTTTLPSPPVTAPPIGDGLPDGDECVLDVTLPGVEREVCPDPPPPDAGSPAAELPLQLPAVSLGSAA